MLKYVIAWRHETVKNGVEYDCQYCGTPIRAFATDAHKVYAMCIDCQIAPLFKPLRPAALFTEMYWKRLMKSDIK